MRVRSDQRGASGILVAGSLMLLVGLAAIAVDLGLGFNERRGDQTAADVGALAGAQSILGGHDDITTEALNYIQANLPNSYTTAEWQTAWRSCVDSEKAALNASGYQFLSMREPTAWGTGSLHCISIDPAGYLRVHLPDQVTDTSFGKAVGVNTIQTNASAIVRFAPRGLGGILPFGILAGSGSGDHLCLQTSSSGTAQPPCDGPSTGNFGVIEAPFYGNTALGTTQNCNASPKNEVLAVNIAIGLDHLVLPDRDGVTTTRQDTCTQIATGIPPDSLLVQTGNPQGTAVGLATGAVLGGRTPRLQQGANPKRNVHGYNLDDRPLWAYLSPTGSYPALCNPATFVGSTPIIDYNLDGTLDEPESWEHMEACLKSSKLSHAGGSNHILFSEDLSNSPRFAYVPQFYETSFPTGTSEWRHIKRYAAVWMEGTWWKKGSTYDEYHPGDFVTHTGSGFDLTQLSGFVIGDAALPSDLRGDTVAGLSSLNPFKPQLYR